MSPAVLQLLRRLSASALVIAALLVGLPRLLGELGVLGPTAEDAVGQAARAVEAARTYGARPDDPAFKAAQDALERARDLARRSQDREARRAAAHAGEQAVRAQRVALVQRDRDRRDAERVVKDLDRQLNGLEDLYASVIVGLDKVTASRALSLMKEARQTGARLFLAYEEGSFGTVLAEQEKTRAALDTAARDLRALRAAAPSPPPGGRSTQARR